jgi:hypothetical protein
MRSPAAASGWHIYDHKETVYQARFLNRIPSLSYLTPYDRFPSSMSKVEMLSKEACLDFDWYIKEVYPGLIEDEKAVRDRFSSYLSNKRYIDELQSNILNQYSKSSSDITVVAEEVDRIKKLLTDNQIEKSLQETHNSRVPQLVPYKHPNDFLVKSLRIDLDKGNSENVMGNSNSNSNSNSENKVKTLPKLNLKIEKLPETDSHEVHANMVRMELVCMDEDKNPALKRDKSIEAGMCSKSDMKAACAADKYYMTFGCPVSCGLCDKNGKLCSDFYEKKCKVWKNEGRCSTEPELMHHACRYVTSI